MARERECATVDGRIRDAQWHRRHARDVGCRRAHALLTLSVPAPLRHTAPPNDDITWMTRVELITIGDELLLGFTIDTNGAHLARELASIGIEVARRTSVGDDATSIASAVRDALDRTGAVITTGGLGPTSDDLTKPSIAALFGREMILDEAHLAWMQERWRTRFHRPMPESNRQQAMLPAGARKL